MWRSIAGIMFCVHAKWVGLVCSLSWAVAAKSDSLFEMVSSRAKHLSRTASVQQRKELPPALTNLNYVQYQQIEFDPEKAPWRQEGLPFHIEFFHPGFIHLNTVKIHEVIDGEPRLFRFSTNFFKYPANFSAAMRGLDFAGFRIIQKGHGEIAVFLGATYFRMIGHGQAFGASARAVAVNTAVAELKEEFPSFQEFWLERPATNAAKMRICGLFEGESVVGAVSIAIQPGKSMVARVKGTFYLRRDVAELGIAPITSMFLHGQNGKEPFSDYRPEVHDSDGLLMRTGSERWIWRPLETGKMLRKNLYMDENPGGFGLIQRERNYERYQDLSARFEKRPSVWVRPIGKWGPGGVELIQLPTNQEFMDNVTAYWKSALKCNAGDELQFSYDLLWNDHGPAENVGKILATRIGRVVVEPPKEKPNLRFVIDFAGRTMPGIKPDAQLEADVEIGSGAKLVADSIFHDAGDHIWRLVVEITHPEKAVDLRGRLKLKGRPVTEDWFYTWQP